jgi:hypothetical protein
MQSEPTLCVVCAWRQDCQKKYMLKQGLTTRCAEFTRDLTIKRERDDTEQDRGDSEGGR